MAVSDREFMARALRLAERGLYTTDPNPRVGCVLVRDGEIVGEGWHQRAGEAHAEVRALEAAGAAARGATAYLNLEPCSHRGRTGPCADALINAGVARVVAAMQDPNPRVAGDGLRRLQAAGVEVEVGLMADAAEALNPGFASRMRRGRPHVRCKLAMSLDGRTAMASGESRWITAEPARRDVHRWRARSSAIVTGIGTVLADDPAMTARLDGQTVVQPLRVILDPYLSTPASARILGQAGGVLVVAAIDEDEPAAELLSAGAEVVRLPGRDGEIDLHAVMDLLAQREINEVLVETGAVLSGAVLRAGLVDELIVYLAPHLMGHEARALFHLPGIAQMKDRIELEIADVRAVGRDWRITAKVRNEGKG